MGQAWLQLLKQPGTYFRDFGAASSSWWVAYAGFYLMTFVESVGNRAFSEVPPPAVTILVRSLLGAIGASLLNAVVIGIIWLWLGSKFLRGKAPLLLTTKACGYAFLYPSIVGLLTVPTMLWLSAASQDSAWLPMLGTVALQVGAGFWALGIALLAVKRLNGFGWIKILVVALWLPSLLVIFIFGSLALP